jgi:hypothetical protein
MTSKPRSPCGWLSAVNLLNARTYCSAIVAIVGRASRQLRLKPTFESAFTVSASRDRGPLRDYSFGGEWGGAALMVAEFDLEGRRRGFYGGLVQAAKNGGKSQSIPIEFGSFNETARCVH